MEGAETVWYGFQGDWRGGSLSQLSREAPPNSAISPQGLSLNRPGKPPTSVFLSLHKCSGEHDFDYLDDVELEADEADSLTDADVSPDSMAEDIGEIAEEVGEIAEEGEAIIAALL